jgi:ribosomal protein L32
VFDEEAYELRRIKVCKECGETIIEETICPVCGSTKFKYESTETEVLTEDIVKGDPSQPGSEQVIAKAGTSIPFYTIKQLPFVVRKNISDDESFYGISDIDLLEENQESMNKILTKMEENILKAGSFVTKPKGVNIPDTDETLKIVTLNDPNQMKAFSVQTVQANMQQDNILQEEFYQMGRDTLGITDSYQGKRDPTAESGKAKQIAAGQSAGRLESKRRMKDAAYADLYKLMFKFLLAYCDEKRTYARVTPSGEYIEGSFSRYNYLDGTLGNVYYNDRFLFSVDSASILSTSREAMWQETLANFQSGTFGNPQDPQSLLLFWNTMKGLNYPLANQALASLQQRQNQLPFEMQQAIMQNPQILQAVQQVLQEGGNSNANNKQ